MSIIRKEQLTNPLSASYALTASYAENASSTTFNTSSLVTTSSFNAFTASINTFTSSYNTGSFSGSFTGSLTGTASWAEYVVNGGNIDTSSFAITGSNIFVGDQIINGENLGFIVDAGNLKRVGFMKYGGLEGSIARVADQNFRILRTTGSNINDGTNAITDFYIAGDGKVGIGTTTPAYTLDISGSSNLTGNQTITGSINFGDGSLIQSISASSGDGGGYATLTLKPDTSLASDQYIVLDPTTPNHIHIRAGGVIDSSSAYLYLGGEKANVVVQNLDYSFNEKYWVQINSQTGSTQNTWTFDDNGVLSAPGRINAPSFSGSFTGSFTGSLLGTSSWAESASQAISSSYASTASNILGGKATHIPFFITDTSLATSSIYQSGSSTVIINQDSATTANPEALYVYQPSTSSFNVISGKGNLNNYLQLNIQNTNQGTSASSDVVATADNGNESTNYIDMGINSENYSQNFVGAANDAYLYSTGRHLHIGNTSNFPVQIFAGGSDVDIHNKLELNPNNQHLMSGSLDVSGSIKAFSFTGSLQGNATSATTSQTSSYSTTLGASLSQPANNQVRLLNSAGGTLNTVTINNVVSASHADNASTADYASIAGNGGVTQLQAGSGVTLIPSTGVGNVIVAATGVGGVTIISGSNVTQSFSNSNTWTFNHNLQTRVPIISVFDSNYNQIIPQNIELTNTSSATITFPTAESGFAVASLGGATGYVLSSSYASLAEYANTASFYPESDPVYIAQKPTLATTGSNTFRGTQTVTGSLFTSGSNTLIGTTVLTGSLNITGSTTQTGENTLIGNIILSGSIGISGSSTIQGTTTMSGSLNISGSTTQTGNNTLIGTTTLTGSINISGDIIPTASSSFDLGSETNPWRSIYVQSGSISIQSDIPGGISAVISNANGNVTIAGAGLQLKSGSFIPFEISSTARTVIRIPNIPANDIGGLSIIGSSDGTYQPVINPSGMIHVTSNDNQAARITVDGFGSNIGTIFVGRHARGTSSTPTPTLLGDVLVRFAGLGYATSSYFPVVGAVPTSLEFQATENYSTSSYGSRAAFYTYANGAVSRSLVTTIDTTGITIPTSSRFFGTASWAENALTASFLPVGTYNITSSWAISASQAVSASFATTASFVKNAQTASYINPLTQDVTITGSLKISGSLTEIGDTVLTGSLTLSSGSALRINNGFYVDGNRQFNYGQFSSTITQSGSANTAYSATFDTTDFSQGVSLVAGSRITVSNTGLYNVQFSSQLHTTANQAVDFSIWFAMTGSNIANSNTDFTIEKIAGGGYVVAALNFLTQIASGSYIELKYSKTTAQGQLLAKGTQSTPTRPATPSVILTVTQVA